MHRLFQTVSLETVWKMPEGFSTAGLWQREGTKFGVLRPSWRPPEPRFELHSEFPDRFSRMFMNNGKKKGRGPSWPQPSP